MRIYNRRDFYSGILFVFIGAFFGIYAQDYSMGSASRMGPGYLPTLLAGIMLFLGLVVLIMAFLPKEAQDPPEPTDWRGIGLVLASVAGFALLLPIAGFLIALACLVFLSAAASHESNRKETVLLAIVLAAVGVGVFGYGIELQFPILPPFLTR
jgi:nitric oxide reductase large subunit